VIEKMLLLLLLWLEPGVGVVVGLGRRGLRGVGPRSGVDHGG